MAATATRPNTHPMRAEPTAVPFTRASLDGLRKLRSCFHALARPLPEYAIVEIAILRLCSEYCLDDNEIQATDLDSARLIKKNSRQVLDARYREYRDIEVVTYRSRHKLPKIA